MKKIIILLIAVSMLLSGCWDLTESEKLGLVTVIGVDTSGNDQIKVVIHEISEQKQSTANQKGGTDDRSPVKLHETIAPTISEAVENIASEDYRRTYFAHTSVIILSEELANSKGIGSVIDYFQRNPEIRRNTWLLITKKGQFDKIFNNSASIEPGIDTGKVIKEIISNMPRNSFLTANTLGDFLNLLWETGSQPYTSGIQIVEINKSKEGQSEATSADGYKRYDFRVENMAVFKKDRLIGWMDDLEGFGFLCVMGGIKGGSLSVNINDKTLSLMIESIDSDLKPVITDGKMQMNIRIKAVSNISESQVNADYENKELIERIQDLQAEDIKKHINLALEKSKQLDSDVFGFGNYFYGKYPEYWKQVQENGYDYYRNVAVNIDVNSTVNQIGIVRKVRD